MEQREYQKACIKDIVNALNDSSDALIALPTGTGKTVVFSPVVAESRENNSRTLVLGATKQAQSRIEREIKRFLSSGDTKLVFGVEEYDCPLLKSKAESWYCRENKVECKKLNISCAVIQSEKDYHDKPLVITNFSKFLLAQGGGSYDFIVLDDSHSFENAKEQAYQLTIQAADGNSLYEKGISNDKIKAFVEDFLNIFAQAFERCLNPSDKDGVGVVSPDYIAHFASLSTKHDSEKLKKEIGGMLAGKDRKVCLNMYYFVMHCTKASRYEFFVRSDFYNREWIDSELISRQVEVDYLIKSKFGNSAIIYATATPGDAFKHANSCSLRNYDDSNLKITPIEKFEQVENWFKNLNILVVTDIGDTRETGPFDSALNLTTEILTKRNERSLILFKNYRDQRKANERLKGLFSPNRLFFLDSTIDNSDFVENLASKSQISLASASSTLWEGINIQSLRIAIITTAPFIRPIAGKKMNYPDLERRMLIRLQQGIGRIIRSESDFGVSILMDSRFQGYVKKKYFDKRLLNRTKFVTADQVMPIITEVLEKGAKE